MGFDFQPVLQGRRMTLRPMKPDDHAGLHAAGADPAVWALHPQPERATDAGFRAYSKDQLASGGALVAVNRSDGALAGCSRYSSHYTETDEIEVGWTFLARSYWGGPYNTEMKWLMLRHAFRYVPRVVFRIGDGNLRSRRAIEKIGAVLTGRVQQVTLNGRQATHLFYAITRTDFARSPFARAVAEDQASASPQA